MRTPLGSRMGDIAAPQPITWKHGRLQRNANCGQTRPLAPVLAALPHQSIPDNAWTLTGFGDLEGGGGRGRIFCGGGGRRGGEEGGGSYRMGGEVVVGANNVEEKGSLVKCKAYCTCSHAPCIVV